MAAAAPGRESLVKYDTPVLVLGHKAKPTKPVPTRIDKKAPMPSTDDILATLLPPRSWTQDGQLWTQHVSSTPATRIDVVNLQEALDLKLQQRQARETGICPIREELYAQTFDEIIRQISIACSERGLLLLRVRDEIRMTIAAYQALYESSIAFGMRKALMAEQKKAELHTKIQVLSAEVSELEHQVSQLGSRCEEMESLEKERYAHEEEKHAQEVAKHKAVNDQLKDSLEALLAPPAMKK